MQSQFEPNGIFISKKKPWPGSHHTLRASKRFLVEKIKIMIESMVKKMLKMKDWKGLKVENALNMIGKRGFN